MQRVRRVKTTDLSILRRILVEDLDPENLESSNNYNCDNSPNEIDKIQNEEDDIEEKENLEDNYDKIDAECDINQSYDNLNVEEKENHVKKIPKKVNKKPKESELKPPFLLTRINTKHFMYSKDNLETNSKDKSNHKLAPYKSIHFDDILKSEDRIKQHFVSLNDCLEREILSETTKLCENSMREARQMLQNSVAVSRMVSGLIEDYQGNCEDHQNQVNPTRTWSVDTSRIFSHFNENITPNIDNKSTELFGYQPGYSSDRHLNHKAIKHTEHQLDESQTHLRQWLERKRIQEKIEKEEREHEQHISRTVAAGAERIKLRRQQAAKESYEQWKNIKMLEAKEERKLRMMDRYESENESDTIPTLHISPMLTDKSVQPLHNYVFRRPKVIIPRPKTVASFNIRRNVNMTVKGESARLENPVRQNTISITYPPVMSRSFHDTSGSSLGFSSGSVSLPEMKKRIKTTDSYKKINRNKRRKSKSNKLSTVSATVTNEQHFNPPSEDEQVNDEVYDESDNDEIIMDYVEEFDKEHMKELSYQDSDNTEVYS